MLDQSQLIQLCQKQDSWIVCDMLRFLRVFGRNLRLAVLSSFMWAVCWGIAFFGSNGIIEFSARGQLASGASYSGAAVQITALALTVAVASSHIPKLISYLMECGTDFQNVFDSGHRKSDGVPYIRLFYSSIFLLFAYLIIWDRVHLSTQNTAIISLDFAIYSMTFWPVIVLIYATQIVFSWPEEDHGAYLLDGPIKPDR